MTKPLTMTRSADRQSLAGQIHVLARALGCETSEKSGGDHPGKRAIVVDIAAPGGLCLSVYLNGGVRDPDCFVLSWHMDYKSDAKLSHSAFLNVNPYHRHKATDVARGADELLRVLEKRLTACKDGSAYLGADEMATA